MSISGQCTKTWPTIQVDGFYKCQNLLLVSWTILIHYPVSVEISAGCITFMDSCAQ